ncbi:enoyl-CoA hydratase-related protein, partial [Pelagibacteraceae bacterium]|nr:enoyl-CoA hydratase-related protein [Pelagibacteraceae bacterium]
IIKSTGPSFCSGHDLKEVKQSSSSKYKLLELFKTCSKMMLSIRSLPLPVIACVDGVAAAAGCQLVASCDLAIASKKSSFQTPGVNIGLFCSTPMVSISRKVQIKDIMYMLLTGDALNASKAKEIGLINEVVMKKDLDKKVFKIANKIASKSFQSIKIGKEAFYNQLEMPIADAYAYTSKVMTLNMQAKEAKEGINAFIEKRKPVWKK